MKKFIFTLLVVCISAGAFAQFEKGTMIVGGNVGLEFNTSKSKYENTTSTNGKSTSFALEPKFGYFLINNLAVGAELGLGLASYKPDGLDGKSTSTTITFGPFARYYFNPGVFVESKFALGSMKSKDSYFGDTEESKYAISGWSMGAGYALFLNDNIALEPMVGFRSTASKDKTPGEPAIKDISTGLFLRMGFQIYLR